MNSKEALKRIYNDAISMNEIEEDVEEIKKDYELIKQDLDRLEQLEKENQKLKNKANKWDKVISGNLWRDGKTRTNWHNKIRSQKDWIDYLSHLRECQSNDDEQLLRIVNHLDTQVLYWALLSLEKEIKRYSEEKFEDE